MQALIRKYGGPSVLDCPLPLSLPDDDVVVAPASPLLLALAQASQHALGITEEEAFLFEQAIGQLDASEAVTVRGMPVALVREYAMHCASPQFAPDPAWTARVLLEHFVDSHSRWLTGGKFDVNFGYDVLRQWTEDFASLLSAPSVTELADLFVFSAAGRFSSVWSDEARVIRDAVTAWCVPASPRSSEDGEWSELEHVRFVLSRGSPFPDGTAPPSP
jgi:hypothetical protein